MGVFFNAALLFAVSSGIMPFPGAAYTGSVIREERAACHVWLWEGMAPKLSALDQNERRQLQGILKEIEDNWDRALDWPSKARLMKPYLEFVSPARRGMFEPDRDVTYQVFTLTCGSDKVRGVQALFSFLEGGILVLGHPASGSYLVVGEYQPQAEEERRLLGQFLNQYKAELEQAESPESLPAEIKKDYVALQRQFEAKETKRVLFWDVNGMLLPSCPSSCPQGMIRYALHQLPQEAHNAFTAFLARYDALRVKTAEGDVKGGRISAVLETWPDELGKNPWLGSRLELKRAHKELVTFAPPSREFVEELWGGKKALLPEFDGNLAAIIKTMRKSVL